jgi:hypothetical protein
MSTQVIVTLPDEVYQRAERLAQLTGRNVADILADTADTIVLSLPPLDLPAKIHKPITDLSDEDVLTLAELQMHPDQDRKLSLLLDQQQAGGLPDAERVELLALMQLYQEGLLRKAQALHEAVKRGLREPLEL